MDMIQHDYKSQTVYFFMLMLLSHCMNNKPPQGEIGEYLLSLLGCCCDQIDPVTFRIAAFS